MMEIICRWFAWFVCLKPNMTFLCMKKTDWGLFDFDRFLVVYFGEFFMFWFCVLFSFISLIRVIRFDPSSTKGFIFLYILYNSKPHSVLQIKMVFEFLDKSSKMVVFFQDMLYHIICTNYIQEELWITS